MSHVIVPGTVAGSPAMRVEMGLQMGRWSGTSCRRGREPGTDAQEGLHTFLTGRPHAPQQRPPPEGRLVSLAVPWPPHQLFPGVEGISLVPHMGRIVVDGDTQRKPMIPQSKSCVCKTGPHPCVPC